MFHLRLTLLLCLFSPALVGQNLKPNVNHAQPSDSIFISFSVPGSNSTVPLAINDFSTVTGYYNSATVNLGGFLRYANGAVTTFEFPGAGETEPFAINDQGDVTGIWTVADSYGAPFQGFVRSRWGAFSSINIPGSTSVWPVRINNQGTVVGYYSTASDYGIPYTGFIRSPNGKVTSYSLPGAEFTALTSINDRGEITGYSYDGVSETFFALSPKGVLTSFGDGDPESINVEGDIAGTYSGQQVYIRSAKGAITLFTVPGAIDSGGQYLSINDLGTVVSSYSPGVSSPISHGFIRSADGALTSFDPPQSSTTVATGLNNLNVVTGFYYIGTNTSSLGFLRIPTRY